MLLISTLIGIKQGYAIPKTNESGIQLKNNSEKMSNLKKENSLIEILKKEGVNVNERKSMDGVSCGDLTTK